VSKQKKANNGTEAVKPDVRTEMNENSCTETKLRAVLQQLYLVRKNEGNETDFEAKSEQKAL